MASIVGVSRHVKRSSKATLLVGRALEAKWDPNAMTATLRGVEALRELVLRLCEDLRSGRFAPVEKVTIRQIAEREGTTSAPGREALYRLVADGTLVAETNRSTRVPLLGRGHPRAARYPGCRGGLAAARAAEVCDAATVAKLQSIDTELQQARERGDHETDRRGIYEFQFTLYRACAMPHLIRIIEGLWLRTGPYLTLLCPDYVQRVTAVHGDWRERVCTALEQDDAARCDTRSTATFARHRATSRHRRGLPTTPDEQQPTLNQRGQSPGEHRHLL